MGKVCRRARSGVCWSSSPGGSVCVSSESASISSAMMRLSGWRADVDDAAVAEAAAATAGFSGRELAKMVASVQTAVYGGSEPVLTLDLFRRVLAAKVMHC